MGNSLNKIELIGNVGQEPKINDVGESKVIKFSLATSETFKDKSGTLKEEVTWHNIVAWNNKGMLDFNLIKKGQCLSIVGRVRNNKYTSSDGQERNYNDVLANKIELVELNKANGG